MKKSKNGKNENEFFDFLPLLSYNAIFNFCDTVRNTGKTTKAKAWILMRFLKKKKKTLWIRTFDTDVDSIKKDFYYGKNAKALKIARNCGYNVKIENIVQEGEYIYFVTYDTKNKPIKREWFCRIVHLAEAQSIKGNEIQDYELIIYDEYRTKEARINRYAGNQAKDFIDIVESIARDHYVRSFLLGNKETYNNPFYDYLKIKAPAEDFEGIKTYNNSSILIYQCNHVPKTIEENRMNKALKNALKNTGMIGYLYEGKTEGIDRSQIAKLPKTTYYVCGIVIDDHEFSMHYGYDGNVYFRSGMDKNQHVYADKFTNKYRYCERLLRGDKKHFKLLMKALKFNKVYFCDVAVYERAQKLFKILN